MKTSDVTQKYRVYYWVTLVLSWVVIFTPIIYYTILAFINGTNVQKLALGLTFFAALALTAINILKKLNLRCITWLLVLGISFCLNEITTLIIFMAVTTIIDEIVLTPLNRYYREKLSINKEIDKRG